jgi:HK97 family phage portal protein
MRIFGLDITRTRTKAQSLQAVSGGLGGHWQRILDWWPGAWQQHTEVDREAVSAYWAVFACVTLIAGDISKMPVRVMQRSAAGIWQETFNRPVLRKPNRYQTRLEFFASWLFSLLLRGNTYAFKIRDERGFIIALHIMDPDRVTPLVAEDGSVFYQLQNDNLAGIQLGAVIVPAEEVIHSRINALHHPLVGLSPLYACGVAATQGLAIQDNSATFFTNGSMPGGIITVPGSLPAEKARELKALWEANYSGANRGKTAVLADKMTYQPLAINAHDAQLIEQLKMTAEMVCACFKVPGYKIGVGQMPTVNNTAALNQQYYDQCLQTLVEGIELRLDEGLELLDSQQTWFDVKELLRMDPDARFRSHSEAIKGGWLSPNEARRDEDREPVEGGETPYMQQQNYSLAALAKRDEMAMQPPPAAPPAPAPTPEPVDETDKALHLLFRKSPEALTHA